jgi:hypothetical protein
MLLQLGATGADVGKLETRLNQLGLYAGPADNIFGGGVQAGVKAFQKANGLAADGVVGPQTWAALFPDTPPVDDAQPSPLAGAPLAQRCLALTGAFETSVGIPDCFAGLTGDFDGQGISFGVAQWNIGQGTLQPLLSEMVTQNEDLMTNLFHENLDDLKTMLAGQLSAQLAWARSIQDPARHNIFEPWQGLFKALGRTPECQAVQVERAASIHQAAVGLCVRFGVTSERAMALMFDIRVQNGSISAATEATIRADFASIAPGSPSDMEVARLRSIANRRAEAANPQFVEDVRTRKLTIANGTGVVHGVSYDLERQFGIGLNAAA